MRGGEGGIRTPGTLRYNGFQDRRFRPLSHLSGIRYRYFSKRFGHLAERGGLHRFIPDIPVLHPYGASVAALRCSKSFQTIWSTTTSLAP